MSRGFLIAALAASLASPTSSAVAQDAAHDPDWPCIQRKVPELSVAQVWSGPDIEAASQAYRANPEVAALVATVAARRMPLEEAEAAIKTFADELETGQKTEGLTLLFAGLFASLDRERSEVMAGIDRYGRRQKQMADDIRIEQAKLSDLRTASPDSPQVAAFNDRLLAQVRVFNDRQTSLTYVCEVPTLIEQRLFALGRAIQNELPD